MSLKTPHSSTGPRSNRWGLPGLEETLEVGPRADQVSLLLGPIGVGKTMFGVQFLAEELRAGGSALWLRLALVAPAVPDPRQAPLGDSLYDPAKASRLKFLSASLSGAIRAVAMTGRGRVLIEIETAAENLSVAQRQCAAAWASAARRAGAAVLVTQRAAASHPDLLGPALQLADADVVLLLRHRGGLGGRERELVALKLDRQRGPDAPLGLELSAKGLRVMGRLGTWATLDHADTAHERVLRLAVPNFAHEEERRRWEAAVRAALRTQGLSPEFKVELLRVDVLTELYAPQTDFGLLLVYEPTIPYLARQGLLHSLDALVPDMNANFHEIALRRGRVDGKQYGLPLFVSTRALFYRRDLLEKYGLRPPRTWDELESAARQVLRKERDPALKGLTLDAQPLNRFNLLIDLLWTQGQDLYLGEGHWRFNAVGVQTALRRLRAWLVDEPLVDVSCLSGTSDDGERAFRAGRALFCLAWSDQARKIHEMAQADREKFAWMPLPSEDLAARRRTRVGGPILVIPKHCRDLPAAQRVVAALCGATFQTEFYSRSTWPFPARRDVLVKERTRKANPYVEDSEEFLRDAALLEESGWLAGNILSLQNAANFELDPIFQIHALTQGLDSVARKLEAKLAPYVSSRHYSGLVAQAVDLIERRAAGPLDVAGLAKELFVSREHLIREFKRQTGITPLKHIQKRQMDKAREMLEFTHYYVGEVAQALGYKDLSYFGRLFKKILHRSPSEFKRAGF